MAAQAIKMKSSKRFEGVEGVVPTAAEQSDSGTNTQPKHRASASRKGIVLSDDEGDNTTREVATVYKTVSGKVKEVDVLTMKDKDRDVDERKKPAREPNKRKAVDGGERPAKKQRRVENDPWKLESKSVREDWK